jgi:hypothetical protein
VCKILIYIQLVCYPETDQQGYGHSDGQACNIDERADFVAKEISSGDLQIIFEHRTNTNP